MRQLTIIQLSMKRIVHNPRAYLFGFLFLQSIRWLIAAPIITFLFYQSLRLSGLSSVTNANIQYLLTHPGALALLTVLIFLLTLLIFFEFGYYFLLAYSDRHGKKTTPVAIVQQLMKKIPKFFTMHTIVFTIYFFLLLPLASLGLSSSWTDSLHIPRFITDELMTTTSGKILFFGILALVLLINTRFVFSVYYFVIDPHETLRGALRKSWHHSRGKTIRIITSLAGVLLTMIILVISFGLFIFTPLYMGEAIFEKHLPVLAAMSLTLFQGVLFIAGALLQPLLTEAVTVMEGEEGARPETIQFTKRKWVKHPKALTILLLSGFFGMSAIHYMTLTETVYQPVTKIVAHRGYAAVALENTIASLDAAAKAGADYVEMDIQETKDGEFVVYHDETLRRLGGTNEKVSDLTLEELTNRTISNGTYTERIPSFDEYIDRAKALDIALLVEWKTYTGSTKDQAEKLAQLLEEKEVLGEYIVQSLDLQFLRHLEAVDPRIQTSDIFAMNIGGVPDTPAMYLSIEDFSIRPSFMKQLSEEEKLLFVWTVNEERLMHEYMQLGVHGLITNYVSDAVRVRDYYEEEIGLFDRVVWMARQTKIATGL